MATGIFNTQHFNSQITIPSFANGILRLGPNGSAPLFALSEAIGTVKATNWQHGFWTKTQVFPNFNITANIDATQTTITVESTENLLPGQLHQFFETKEIVLVNQILSPTQVSVVRGIGGGAAALTLAAGNPRAYQVGNAYEEASIRPNALAINPILVTNLTQIFRNTWAVSGSATQVAVLAGNKPETENRMDCAFFHAESIEAAAWFSKKSNGYRNGQPFRTMDGLINIVGNIAYYPSSYSTPNVFDALDTGTDSIMLEDMIDATFNQQTDPRIGNERLMFVGGKAMRVLNMIGRLNGEYQLIDGQTSWGLRFKEMHFARGSFTIIEHPLFNTNPDWQKMAVAVDLSSIKFAYLGDRKTDNREFNTAGNQAQDNGIDAVGGTLTTEVTLEVRNPPANAVIYNLTKGLKDDLS